MSDCLSLGDIYRNGIGVPQDVARAAALFIRIAAMVPEVGVEPTRGNPLGILSSRERVSMVLHRPPSLDLEALRDPMTTHAAP